MKSTKFFFLLFVPILRCVVVGALAPYSCMYNIAILQYNSVYKRTISMFMLRNHFKTNRDYGHYLFFMDCLTKGVKKEGSIVFFFF